MPSLCIQDLVNATLGSIRMGTMPPLGGMMAPVGRLVHPGGAVQTGDVVFATLGGMTNGIAEPLCPEPTTPLSDPSELFAMGALGVISDSPVCPWDGRFSLQVADLQASRRSMTQFVREQLGIPVVAVVGNDSAKVTRALQARFGDAHAEGTHAATCDAMETAWRLVAARNVGIAVIAEIIESERNELLATLRPDIVIVSGHINANSIQTAIGLVAANGILVLETTKKGDLSPEGEINSLPKGWLKMEATADASHKDLIRVAAEAIAGEIEKNNRQARVA